jgi:diguanylate cyclase (GGDEF)-like protein
MLERLPFGIAVWEAAGDEPGDLALRWANSRHEPALEPERLLELCLRQEGRRVETPSRRVYVAPLGDRRAMVVSENVSDLRASERLNRQVVEQLEEGVLVLDADGRIAQANPAAERLARLSIDDMRGKTFDQLPFTVRLAGGDVLTPAEGPVARVVRGETVSQLPLRLSFADEPDIWVEVNASALSAGGEPYGAVLTFQDVTERRLREERMRFEAEHDHLTGLNNRRALERALPEAIARAEHTGHGLAVVLVDLDGFKDLNDRYGHLYGDNVLRSVGRRLLSISRDEDVIARYGGDEFVALLPDLSRGRDAGESFCERALEALAHASVDASAGLAVYPDDGEDMEQLLAAADRSMYAEKRAS